VAAVFVVAFISLVYHHLLELLAFSPLELERLQQQLFYQLSYL
jgi:hypothetical protein